MTDTNALRGARILAALLILSCSAAAQAASNLRQELEIVAKGISAEMKELGKSKIDVKGFEFKGSESKLRAAGGPGISQVLTEELQKLKLTVEPGADVMVRGTFVDVVDKKSSLLAAQIKGELLDGSGRTIFDFSRGVFGDIAVATLFGTTTSITPTDDVKKRSEELTEALDNPKVNVAETKISTKKGDPYSIEILVKKGDKYVPRAASTVDGQAFVKIDRDEIYAVRLINDSAEEAAVLLSIDGISMFTFSENKNYTQVIIPAKSTGLIEGWHRSNTVSDAFQVMEYSKSAVAKKLPSSTSVGVITAAFSVCFPADTPPPEDEPPSTKVKDKSRSGDATGQGPQLKSKFNEVERVFGVIRSTVSARYTK